MVESISMLVLKQLSFSIVLVVEAMMVVIEIGNISCVDIGVLKLVDNERQYKSLLIAKK